VPRLPREKRDRLIHREDEKPNRRLKVRWEVWELPPRRFTTPCDKIFIEKEVTSQKVFVLGLGTARVVGECAYKGVR